MKKITLCLFPLLIFWNSGNSQNYDSLVIENAQWRVAYYYDDIPDEMFGWLLRGDTVINGYQYKKVYKRHFQDFNSNVIDTQYLFGVMREDVENKLVYAIQFYESAGGCDTINSEFRLYDFSCQLGDPLLICFTNQFLSIVYSVDTVFYFDKLRRTFISSYSVDYFEGIGHLAGLFENPMMPFTKEINYFYSELIDYCVGSDEECSVYYVKVDNNIINSNFEIYPNPCRGSVTILPPDSNKSIWHYSLYNILGECIQSGLICGNNKVIKIKNQGCYSLKLISDQNLTYTKIVICNY